MKEILSAEEKIDNAISFGYEFRFGEYLERGMEIFKKDMGSFIGFTLVQLVITTVAGFIPFASLLVAPPLAAGVYLVAKRIDKGEQYEFANFFDGFKFFFGQLVLAGLITGIFIVIGIIALIIPGIYLGVALSLVTLLIVFGKQEFWPAIEKSIKIVNKNWFSFFGFFIVLILINLIGLLLLGIGLLFTIPFSSCAMYAAYDDIVGVDDELEQQVDQIYTLTDDDKRQY